MTNQSTMEYKDLTPEMMSTQTVVKEGTHNWMGTPLKLTHYTEGYVVAGSAARHTDAKYTVTFMDGGARHGHSFKSFEAAERRFNEWAA